MDKIVSTSNMVLSYLESNNLTIPQLAEASNLSQRTIRRFINDESKLSYDIAVGVNKLLPNISTDFLMAYDAKYQFQKTKLMRHLNITNPAKVISFFRLGKLYPHLKGNTKLMIEKGVEIFGEDAIKNLEIPHQDFYIETNKED